jgi:hypothetical protein
MFHNHPINFDIKSFFGGGDKDISLILFERFS